MMTVQVETQCPRCHGTTLMNVNAQAYVAWTNGTLIQNAFPDWSADRREALMTGIHGFCWDEMFGGEE